MTDGAASYTLVYWPPLPGRGELVRLVLEQAGVPYDDRARRPADEGGGVPAVLACLRAEGPGLRPLAPPVLVDGDHRLAQVAVILDLLATRHGLGPTEEIPRAHALQLQLTAADLIEEAHDTHHPVAVHLRYEDQQAESLRAAQAFVDHRMPKYLRYFESVLQANAAGQGRHLIGDALSYVDLTIDHVLHGLAYAFPKAWAVYEAEIPGLLALRDHVDALPRIAAYRASDRCLPFGEHGIFRHYEALDLAPSKPA